MNKVYKVIWNVALGTWLAVSELAKGKVKSSSATVVSLAEINNQSIQKEKIGSIAKTTALFAAFALISAQSFAAPETIAASTDNGNSGILPVENLEFWQQLTNNHFVLTNDKRISVGGSLWLGTNARAGGAGIAIGSGAVSADTDNIKGSVAIGNSSYANAGATVLGSLATGGQNAVALGRNALANDEGVAIGRGAQGVGSSAIAIGRSAVANGNNSIAIGNASVATAENSVSFGNATLQRKITNIASGSVNENSTDAMTGKQLFQANKNVAAALGGGAVVLADGQITAPKYSVGGKEVVGVEDAVTALDTRATTNETDIANNKTAIGKNAEDITAVGARVTTNTADISKLNQNVNDGVFSVSANAIGAAKVAKDAVIDYSNTDKNIVITQDGTNFKFDLANNLNVKNSIVVGESTLSSNGLSIAGGPSISATGINANNTIISNLKDGEAAHDAVNKGQLDKLLTDSGLVGDTGESINAVTYDKDGKVTLANNSGLTIGANTLNAAGLTVGNTLITSAGLSFANGGPSISATGINANHTVISNLKDGEAAHDAVNKGQLDKLLTDSGLVDGEGKSINAVTYDKDGKVTLADNGGDGTLISNVAEGKVEAGSKDAVNGSQVAGIRDDLQAKIDGNTSAIGDIQKDLGTMQNDIGGIKQDLASGKLGVVQQADKDATITVGKETGGNKVDMSGTAGDRVVTGVANGAVQKDSKDAVNGSQLNTTNQAIVSSLGGGASFDSTTGEFNAPTYQVGADKHKDVGSAISALDQANQGLNSKIDNVSDRLENAFRSTNDRIDSVEKKANAGIAAAMALESAPFIAGKYTYSAGAAYHGGESAIGVTLRKTSNNGRWSVTGGIAAATQGDASVRIGVSGVIN